MDRVAAQSRAVTVGLLVACGLGALWVRARYANLERLRAYRESLTDQGVERDGTPPAVDRVRARALELAEARGVQARDVTVEAEDVDGLPGPLGASQVGASLLRVVQVRSRQYTIRGSMRSTWGPWSVEEPLQERFSVRLSVTMPPSAGESPPSFGERNSPSPEPSIGRGM
jgi:hypothetical protein